MSVFEETSGDYSYLPIARVHFGPGCISRLAEELTRVRSQRPFLITGQTIAEKTRLVGIVQEASGTKLAGIYSGIKQHAPTSGIRQALIEVRKARADSLISLGGGSPIDSAKVVVKELSENFVEPIVPHIALPTTLSAAEFTHTAGMTDERARKKTGVRDARMTPRLVFLDPELTVETPAWLWASTGIRSLDHAVESVYSPRHQPYVDTLALEAIKLIFQFLKASTDHPREASQRLACQMAAWMSFAGVQSVGTGLSHAIGRVIGATWDIPHGITSCLTLAETMRHYASRSPERLALIAEAEGRGLEGLSATDRAVSAADGVAELVNSIGLSKKLRDYGIERKDLPLIAKEASSSEESSLALEILEAIF